MRSRRSDRLRRLLPILLGIALACTALPIAADEFEADLVRIDQALRTNPGRVSEHALESCMSRRNFAARLHDRGQLARAERSLSYCFELLDIPRHPPSAAEVAPKGPSLEQVRARAAAEIERALTLTPDTARGLEIYRECALCHMPEGWGLKNGSVPQIAGQHRSVVIKQLADIRAGNRDNPNMLPYASADAIGGPQAVADVAAYVDTLEISVENGKGPGTDLTLGETLYAKECARCHGADGQGDAEALVPRIQAQHFNYLVRQFEDIRSGRRRNANAEMAAGIQRLDERETRAVLDYVSRLVPAPELQAPPGWRNPDFRDRTHYDPPQGG